MERKDALTALGFETDVNPNEEEIRRAFKKMVLECHPDKGGSAEKFHNIKCAMEVLLNPSMRKIEIIERSWHKYVNCELDLASLLKTYLRPDYTVKQTLPVSLSPFEYFNRVPITVADFGKHVFESLGDEDVGEYILAPNLIPDKIFTPESNLDVSQIAMCKLSTMLFGGTIEYKSLSEKKKKPIKIEIKPSRKLMDRKITLPGKGLSSNGRTGDMILKLTPDYTNTDYDLIIKNEELIKKIFK